MPDDSVLRDELSVLGHDRTVASVRRLDGGSAAGAWLVRFSDGTRAVAKTQADAADGLFEIEAEGLEALGATGHLAVPDVLWVSQRLLLLGELPERDDSEASWEAFAVALAGLHRATVHDGFGWDHDGYLGQFRQENHWTMSGHEFFAERRLLRYLREPRVDHALTAADKRALEHFAPECRRSSRRCPQSSHTATCGRGTCSDTRMAGWPSSTPRFPARGRKLTCRCYGAARVPQVQTVRQIRDTLASFYRR